jgi:cytochrome d ubiquinol oxidase subunit I
MSDTLDWLLLARMQFAFTIAFHIIFPAFTIGLAGYLVFLEALWLKTRRRPYRQLSPSGSSFSRFPSSWTWFPGWS